MKVYPNWFYPVLLASLIALAVSELLLIPTTLDMRFEWDVIWRISSGQRPVAVVTDTTTSYLMLLLIGALSAIHMRTGLRTQQNHRSGLSLIVMFSILTLTGIGLFYLANSQLIFLASVLHIFVGILLLTIFIMHLTNNRQAKRD